ncbi:hypothetical protein AC578_1539 [Pseudocercospora eumusae]|uniref:Uncharacterized protein n=1 Tax=Pseudocercospora eumusae TaxID=321146 RepID=A0A139HM99_9PEZI|nr:hypothetical protein AC578_1539 [Pseudocercospora eumusae]
MIVPDIWQMVEATNRHQEPILRSYSFSRNDYKSPKLAPTRRFSPAGHKDMVLLKTQDPETSHPPRRPSSSSAEFTYPHR